MNTNRSDALPPVPPPGAAAAPFALPAGWTSLGQLFVTRARERPKAVAMVDSTKASVTYAEALLKSIALGRALDRELGSDRYVGLLLPPMVPSAVTNVAVTLLGRVPVNLNYTAGKDLIDASIHQAGIKKVITSRRALEKFKVEPDAELVLLEDLPKRITRFDKVMAALLTYATPKALLGRFLPGVRPALDEPATIIFTSGSTGDPKGVVLSHRNVLSNVHQIERHVQLNPTESVLGILPFFHSFGFTVTLWTVLGLGFKGLYHYSPLDARVIGNLCDEHKATIVFATPTFVRGFMARCDRSQFSSVRLPILGAEKLKPELAREIQAKLGFEPLEGYGCTETGPVVAVNVPHSMQTRTGQPVAGNRPGTVGLLLPGTEARTVDPETEAVLPQGAVGLVQVRGPQVMVGYLNRPEATAKVLRDGWYNTGDLGFVDADGFLSITDRLSRFSKIGGEMVPHTKVESSILQSAGLPDQHLAVTAIPDPKRGERLVVVHTPLPQTPEVICQGLLGSGMPRLWLPAPDDFIEVAELPVLGTGKLDLRSLRQIALDRLGQPAGPTPDRQAPG